MEDCDLLYEAAQMGAEIALSYFAKNIKTWTKAGNSPVSEADLAVDSALKAFLLNARPEYGWISEESADARDQSAFSRFFVLDPIDGTRGFLSKSKIWCISLAIIEEGRPIASVLYCPLKEELYKAIKGKGAYLNGKLLSPHFKKPQSKVHELMLSVPLKLQEAIDFTDYKDFKLLWHAKIPSLAYCFALAVKGEVDIIITRRGCYDWDIAAVDLILEELGQFIIDNNGNKVRYGVNDYRHAHLFLYPKDCKKLIETLQTYLQTA